MCRSTEVAVKQALGAGEVDVQKTRQEVEPSVVRSRSSGTKLVCVRDSSLMSRPSLTDIGAGSQIHHPNLCLFMGACVQSDTILIGALAADCRRPSRAHVVARVQ